MSDKATIKIYRRANFLGCLHKLNLFVDDENMAIVCNNEEKVFEVSAVSHKVFIQFGFGGKSKTIEINLLPGEIKSLECGINTRLVLLLILGYGIAIAYFSRGIISITVIIVAVVVVLWSATLLDSYLHAYDSNYFFLSEAP